MASRVVFKEFAGLAGKDQVVMAIPLFPFGLTRKRFMHNLRDFPAGAPPPSPGWPFLKRIANFPFRISSGG